MARLALLFLLFFPGLAQNESPAGSRDPAFERIPFAQWFAQNDDVRFRWSVDVPLPVLSVHQRFATRVQIKVDGDDLARRKGAGELVMFVQVEDEKGAIWQSHDSIDLAKIQESVKTNDIEYLQPLFVMPGQYTFSVAIYDSATKEHAVAQRKIKFPPLKGDPLPQAWKNFPNVEFIGTHQPPDNFYLPDVEGKLELHASTPRKTVVDIVVNLTPSERLSGSKTIQDRQLGVLLPAFKTLSQIQWKDAVVNTSFLDLSERKTLFHQEDLRQLDWTGLSAGITERKPGMIDAKTLGQRNETANFFVSEVAKKIRAAEGEQHVIIILSSPVVFEPGVEFHPIEMGPQPGLKLFYLRYQPLPPPPLQVPEFGGRGGRLGPLNSPPQQRGSFGPLGDKLESLFKPLNPRLFDIDNPIQFRKAVAAILTETARP
jgi:hypothetical protein